MRQAVEGDALIARDIGPVAGVPYQSIGELIAHGVEQVGGAQRDGDAVGEREDLQRHIVDGVDGAPRCVGRA